MAELNKIKHLQMCLMQTEEHVLSEYHPEYWYITISLIFSYFREDPSCVNTVTFCQFLFIAVEGFIFTAHFGTKKPVIPIR